MDGIASAIGNFATARIQPVADAFERMAGRSIFRIAAVFYALSGALELARLLQVSINSIPRGLSAMWMGPGNADRDYFNSMAPLASVEAWIVTPLGALAFGLFLIAALETIPRDVSFAEDSREPRRSLLADTRMMALMRACAAAALIVFPMVDCVGNGWDRYAFGHLAEALSFFLAVNFHACASTPGRFR